MLDLGSVVPVSACDEYVTVFNSVVDGGIVGPAAVDDIVTLSEL